MKRILVILAVVAFLGACGNHSKQQQLAEGEKKAKCCEMKADSTGDGCGKHHADSTKLDTTMGADANCGGKDKPCCASKDSTQCKKK